MDWFSVDKQGLAKLLERKGKEFILFELIQNSWDEKVTQVNVTLKRIPGTRNASLIVEDDSPDGFADLKHTFTLFAESTKKGDATKRGRFNLGEKLVLAMCEEAQIISTKGGVRFDSTGRHMLRTKRDKGSVFTGVLKLTDEELGHCSNAVFRLLPPALTTTYFNGQRLDARTALSVATVPLPTEVAGLEGRLCRTVRQTSVNFYEPIKDEIGTLYELGIPVVETGDRFHVNVMQKVPLNFDRDNVTPGYLAQIRALTLEHLADNLTTEDANSTWVRDAIEMHGDELSDDVVHRVVDLRFGDKRVAYDPSDLESNSRAVAAGYTVIHGRSLSSAEWDAVKRVGAVLPAGQVTPSPKPYSPDGKPLKTVSPDDWTPSMRSIAAYAKRVASHVLNVNLQVTIVNDVTWGFGATYGDCGLVLNLGRLGHTWFNDACICNDLVVVNDLLIHEFAHHYESNHLSEKYYDALSKIGSRMVQLALDKSEVFQLSQKETV